MERTHTPADGPGDLTDLKARLDAWRRTPDRSRRVPEHFWQEAVGLCRFHAVSSVSRRLGLTYSTLRQRCRDLSLPQPSTPSFVEMPGLFPAQELTIEYQQASGGMLRIHCRGPVPGRVLDLLEVLGRSTP